MKNGTLTPAEAWLVIFQYHDCIPFEKLNKKMSHTKFVYTPSPKYLMMRLSMAMSLIVLTTDEMLSMVLTMNSVIEMVFRNHYCIPCEKHVTRGQYIRHMIKAFFSCMKM